jgi:hypothetical protein
MVAVEVSLFLSFSTNANSAVEPPNKMWLKKVDLRVYVVAMRESVLALLLEQGA